MRAPLVLGAAVMAAALLLGSCSTGGQAGRGDHTTEPTLAAEQLTVFGAASTRVINDSLSEAAGDSGITGWLNIVNAGSSTLVQQLSDGAPGDLLLTADQRTMDAAVTEGVVADPVALAENSMVMVVPAGNPGGVGSVDALDGATVVLCDEQAPCGAVSRAIMDDLGLRIEASSLEQSVSDVLGKVISGEADAGWVYRTDAQAAGDSVEIIDIPGADKHPNRLYGAVARGSENPDAAARLLELLASPRFAGIWSDHGFAPAA